MCLKKKKKSLCDLEHQHQQPSAVPQEEQLKIFHVNQACFDNVMMYVHLAQLVMSGQICGVVMFEITAVCK